MDTNLTKIKNEILAFLLATFLITFGMGLIMFFVYKHIDASGVQAFAIVQMLYPALAAIVFLPFLFTKEYKGKMSEG